MKSQKKARDTAGFSAGSDHFRPYSHSIIGVMVYPIEKQSEKIFSQNIIPSR